MKKGLSVTAGLCAICMFITTMTGCSNSGKSGEVTSFNDNSYTTDVEKPQKQEYSWIIKPNIQADNIISFDASQVNPDDEQNSAYANYSIIQQDGKYGIIDYQGNTIINPEYDDYYTCWCGEVSLVNYIDQRNGVYDYCSIDSSNQVVNYTPEHYDNAPEYFWADNKVYVKNKGQETGTLYDGKKAVVVGEADIADAGNGQFTINPKENSLYGIAKQNKLIVNIEYTDYYAPSYKGAGLTGIALQNNEGKWGIVDSAGKQVIDFVCDGDPNAYNGFLIDNPDKNHPYLYTGDYIPVCTDGSYSYYNKQGKCVVSSGEFEQARPVHNGKAWVKQNGMWGVIQLGKIVKDDNSKAPVQTSATTNQTNNNNNNWNNTDNWNQTTYNQT